MEQSLLDAIGNMAAGFGTGCLVSMVHFGLTCYLLPKKEWQPTASHREGPEHDQHDVCDQYSRKGLGL